MPIQLFLAVMALGLCAMANGADIYTYDKLNRLTQVQYGNGASVAYGLDSAGNILTITNVSAPTLAAQTVSFGAAPSIKVGGTGVVSATATSGLAVTFRAATPGVCSLASNGVDGQMVVSGVTASLCSVGASQAGNGVYAPAPEVLQVFSIAPANLTPPSAPSITSVVAGSGRITVNFTAPTSNGGAAIASYTATCTAPDKPTKTATGASLQLVVTGLTGGVLYTCFMTASNGFFASAVSATASTTPGPAPNLAPILMLLLD